MANSCWVPVEKPMQNSVSCILNMFIDQSKTLAKYFQFNSSLFLFENHFNF